MTPSRPKKATMASVFKVLDDPNFHKQVSSIYTIIYILILRDITLSAVDILTWYDKACGFHNYQFFFSKVSLNEKSWLLHDTYLQR